MPRQRDDESVEDFERRVLSLGVNWLVGHRRVVCHHRHHQWSRVESLVIGSFGVVGRVIAFVPLALWERRMLESPALNGQGTRAYWMVLIPSAAFFVLMLLALGKLLENRPRTFNVSMYEANLVGAAWSQGMMIFYAIFLLWDMFSKDFRSRVSRRRVMA